MSQPPDNLAAAAQSPQIVVAGNICLDMIPAMPTASGFAPGKLLEVGAAAISTGGAVANVGLALHRLGTAVRLMGIVGDDFFGRAILEILRAHDAALADDMLVSREAPTSYSLVISPPEIDRMFLHCPGANDAFGEADIRYERMRGAKILHFGYPPLMRRMRLNDGQGLCRLFSRAREMGLATSLDLALPDPASEAGKMNWPALLERILPLVDVFLPSLDELLFMVDRPAFDRLKRDGAERVLSRPLVEHLTRRMIAMGAAVAVLKLGDQGLFLRTSADAARLKTMCDRLGLNVKSWTNQQVFAPCFAANVVGTTGSGDATIAGFLAAILRGDDPAAAVTAATAVGACSVEAADATSAIPSWAKIERRLRENWLRLPVKWWTSS